jgi:hypothetical protein
MMLMQAAALLLFIFVAGGDLTMTDLMSDIKEGDKWKLRTGGKFEEMSKVVMTLALVN